MIHDEITDVLLRARIPASTKGFIYIHDALEIMDKDSRKLQVQVGHLHGRT